MRKFTLTLLFISAAILTAVSCSKDEEPQNVTVTFDMAQIDDSGYINDGTYTENGITFANSYDATYGSWSGFALSNCTDMQTTGYANQYSVYATSGAANSRNFAVAYYEAYTNTPAKFSFEAGKEFTINSLAVNNSTYVYLDILNGSAYSKKFTTGDWYKVIFTGYTSAGTEAGKVEFYAADYREVGALKAFADSHNVALLLVHHLRKMKDDGDPFNMISGTNGIMGAADTTMVLTKEKRGDSNATFSVVGRDVESSDTVLRFNKDTCYWEFGLWVFWQCLYW